MKHPLKNWFYRVGLVLIIGCLYMYLLIAFAGCVIQGPGARYGTPACKGCTGYGPGGYSGKIIKGKSRHVAH